MRHTQGPACARINVLDKFDLSDEELRDALDSSPLESFREAPPIPTVAEREKSWTHQVNASQATAANTFVGRTETSLGFIGRAQAGPLSAKADGKPPALSPVSNGLRAKMIEADFMSCHVPLLRWTQLTPAKQAEKLPLTPSERAAVWSAYWRHVEDDGILAENIAVRTAG